MERLKLVVFLAAVCSIFAFTVGCRSENAAATSTSVTARPAPQTMAGGQPRKEGAATPDVDIYPAPSGVKTGLEGGRK